jgi:transposase InsO family protein
MVYFDDTVLEALIDERTERLAADHARASARHRRRRIRAQAGPPHRLRPARRPQLQE